jgi:dTMP kinase
VIVAIEGGDAVGKATQSRLLAGRLGGEVVSFPDYGTRTGEAILEHLNNKWRCSTERYGATVNSDHDALAFQCLMTVNRLELAPRVRALQDGGKSIVFDRYWSSAVVYGQLEGLDPRWLEQTQSVLANPDLWILIDVPVEESHRRRPERRDRYEVDRDFAEKVRVGYLQLFVEKRRADLPWYVVDGSGSIEETRDMIWTAVEDCRKLNYRTT